ncbi:MAG: 4-hydroxythreonine-4-phosphate dehydrogenase PdxA [Deltaproteobacteria bacterium]|nr:MAG: 4-hydroxythreonine-4-phosphate dehydrogenase PdxA [Deltaproteobacteria bacterium]
MGDPAGIGPEIIAMVLGENRFSQQYRVLVLGDETAMVRAMGIVGKGDPPTRIETVELESLGGSGPFFFAASSLSELEVTFGQPSDAAATATIDFIRQAVRAAQNGIVEAVCTAPVNKSVLKRAGFTFPGHTEFLQDLTQARRTAMMLSGASLRVSLVTTHCALAEVPALLDVELVAETIRITHQALADDFGIEQPRLAVAGLNPHAGEQGIFGDEEQRIIGPAVVQCQQQGITVSGPLPPDTVFFMAHRGRYDAVVSMYHDQGLIPLKLLHFQNAVNVTLGLPIIRTSVDHGTAYELAGTGKANPASLREALDLAARMAQRRRERRA